MVSIGGMMSTVLGWFSSVIFWIIAALILLILGAIIVWVRKKRALIFECFELNFLKDGKQVVEHRKAGWFGKNSAFFGLIERGKEKILKTDDGRIINDFSIDDYHEYRRKNKQKRCILCTPHPEDKSILVPVSHATLDQNSLAALYNVAPADFREAAVQAFEESTKELRGQFDRLLPYILLGGIVIFFIIGIIINGQLISRSVDTAQAILADAGDTLEKVAGLISTRPSATAP